MLDTHEILVRDRRRVREGERERLHGAVERAPDVYDAVPAAQERVCFDGVGNMVSDPGFGRCGGLVDVHARHRGAWGVGVGAADGVVEEQDAVGAGDVVEDEALDFGVVGLLDVGVGREVWFGGVGVGGCGEGFEGVIVKREG